MSKAQEITDWCIERGLNVFERIWPLIKGAPHNRLAWIVTLTGLTILSGPLWETIVRSALEKFVGIKLDQPPGPIWGFALVVVALIYHFFAYRADKLRLEIKSNRIREHDGRILRDFESKYPHSNFHFILNFIDTDHSVTSDREKYLTLMTEYLLSPSNHLLDDALRTKAATLAKNVEAMQNFIGKNFFVPRAATNANRCCLQPDWNCDRCATNLPTPDEESQYDQLANKLSELVRDVLTSYDELLVAAHYRAW